jgi:hypothetical protein
MHVKSVEEIALASDPERHPKVVVHPDLPAQARRHHHQPPRVATAVVVPGQLAATVSWCLCGAVGRRHAARRRGAVAARRGRRVRPWHGGRHVLAVEVLVGADGAPRLGLHADAHGRRGRRHTGGPPEVDVRVLARAHGVPAVGGVGS